MGFMLQTFDQDSIKAAIANVEQTTSAEIKVVVRRHCWGPLHDAARKTFYNLKLDQTRFRNAALIFVVIANRDFLIFGDEGINNVVADDFWVQASTEMTAAFQNESLTAGILTGIRIIGAQLAEHFPADSDNPNEISNDVVIEDA